MILAVKGLPKRGTDALEVGDRFGATVAQSDIVKAALQFNIVDAIHVLVDDLHSPGIQVPAAATRNDGTDDLKQQFGPERVRVTSLLDASSCFNKGDCLLLSAGSDLVYRAAARPYLSSVSFPISSLLYALKWDTLFSLYAYTKVVCEPYDSLVVPSAAGRKALDVILGEAEEIMGQAGRSRTALAQDRLKIADIPLGVDENCFFPGDRAEARQQFGIPQACTVLLYFGRLTEHHKADLEPLLVVTSKLVREDPSILLVLSGQDTRGIYAKLVYELGAMLGIGSNLKILPNLAPKRKPLLYAAADVFVSPVDNIQETFGLALLEAMATGLPVVASDWSGYRDIVRNGTEGFLIPTYWSSPSAETAGHYSPVMDSSNEYYLAQHTLVDTKALYERLRLLVRNPELRQQLGAAGSARARAEFSWRAVIHKFGALWSQQLEDCRIKMSEPRSAAARPSFDYDSMFSHYATEILDNQDIITLDREITDCAQLLRNRISGLTSESLAASIIEVVEKCYPGSKPLGDVLTKGNRISLDAVLWLLKKGFCHISPASTD